MPKNLYNPAVLLTLILAAYLHPVNGQNNIPMGTWRTHLNYSNARKVMAAGDKIFCSTGHSVFYYDKADGSLNKLTRQDGLSDLSVTAMGFDSRLGIMVLGSSLGNIDLVVNNQISQIDDIAKSSVAGSKRINHISFFNQYCFVSTDFGVPVIDLEAKVIRETYFPGFNGNPLAVYGSAVLNDTLYLATEDGILAGALNDQTNLIDFRNWERLENLPDGAYFHIARGQENLYAATSNLVYKLKDYKWEIVELNLSGEINSLSAADDGILICDQAKAIKIDYSGGIEYFDDILIVNPRDAAQDKSGAIWIADFSSGLATNLRGSFTRLTPSGPGRNLIARLEAQGDSVIAVSGMKEGPNPEDAAFYVFSKGKWTNYQVSQPEKKGPLIDIAANGATRKIYFASYGGGLVEWDGKNIRTFNLDETTLPSGKVSALAADGDGGLWMIADSQQPELHSLNPDNTWTAYATGISQASMASALLVNSNGDKWIASDGSTGGIIVYNEKTNRSRLLTVQPGSGGLPPGIARDLALDHDGFIWAATDNGVAYFSNPSEALANRPIDAFIPIFDGRRLFQGTGITAIAIDPGNRKWIGANNGVWLFNETMDELIHHFTSTNSPLPSDSILDIAINAVSGEAFIATRGGLASFREQASAPFARHDQAMIFPNPVTPGYSGLVGVTGLVGNAQVKITDISGRLVWQGRATGGGIAWDIRDFRGKRVEAGVYLIFSANADGSETFVGKIAVIN